MGKKLVLDTSQMFNLERGGLGKISYSTMTENVYSILKLCVTCYQMDIAFFVTNDFNYAKGIFQIIFPKMVQHLHKKKEQIICY